MTAVKQGLLTKRGAALLLRAAEQIEKYPETLNMATWLYRWKDHRPEAGAKSLPRPYCGTTACLAGHVALLVANVPERPDIRNSIKTWWLPRELRDKMRKLWPLFDSRDSWDVKRVALAALGLQDSKNFNAPPAAGTFHVNTLFLVDDWPEPFRTDYFRVMDHERAIVAAARVRYFIQTGK